MMNAAARLTVLFVLLLVCVAARGGDKIIRDVNVDVALVSFPEAEFKRGDVRVPDSDAENRWLMISVGYVVRRPTSSVPEYREVNGRKLLISHSFADGMFLDVNVLLDTGLRVNGYPLYGSFCGRTEFFTVRRDGRRHIAWMFIPAKLIDRCCMMPNGAVRKAAKGDFKVEAVISMGGRELAHAYCNVSGKEDFEKIKLLVPDNLHFVGGVFPRSRTPWGLLETGSFDVEKP